MGCPPPCAASILPVLLQGSEGHRGANPARTVYLTAPSSVSFDTFSTPTRRADFFTARPCRRSPLPFKSLRLAPKSFRLSAIAP